MVENKRYSNRLLFKRVALWTAVNKGRHVDVMKLISDGADVRSFNSDNVSLLWLAAQNGDDGVVKLLVDALKNLGGDALFSALDKKGPYGSTALMIAVQNGYAKAVGLLVDALNKLDKTNENSEFKAALNEKDSGGATALWIAAKNGDDGVVKLLVDTLKDNLADIEFKTALNQKGPFGATAIVIAAENGHIEVVKLLVGALKDNLADIELRAPLNQKGPKGITALWIAAQNGHTSVVKLLVEELNKLGLVEFKAALNQKGHCDATALMQATYTGKIDVVKLLLEAGADPNFKPEFDASVTKEQQEEIKGLLKDAEPAQEEAKEFIKRLTATKSRWVFRPKSTKRGADLKHKDHPSFRAIIQATIKELEQTELGSAGPATEKTLLLEAVRGSSQKALIDKLKHFLPSSEV